MQYTTAAMQGPAYGVPPQHFQLTTNVTGETNQQQQR